MKIRKVCAREPRARYMLSIIDEMVLNRIIRIAAGISRFASALFIEQSACRSFWDSDKSYIAEHISPTQRGKGLEHLIDSIHGGMMRNTTSEAMNLYSPIFGFHVLSRGENS
ncbi:MAG: hypothetical protein V5A88_02100 [Candidatus Thermoplasmatota archaeon]